VANRRNAASEPEPANFYEAVYRVVRTIPRGKVMTYGQIAVILGHPRAARAVGYALKASARHDDVPWQRVINHKGRISARSEVERPLLQRELLEAEGIEFDEDDCCDLTNRRWEPPEPERFVFEPRIEFPI